MRHEHLAVALALTLAACSAGKDTSGDTAAPTEVKLGYLYLCTDLAAGEETVGLDLEATVVAVGAAGDASAPADLCSSVSQYVVFTDGEGAEHFIGWSVTDVDGAEIGPPLSASAGDVLAIHYAQSIPGYTYLWGLVVRDDVGELQLALSYGDLLDAAHVAPLVVAREASPYAEGSLPCGQAEAYRLQFTSDVDDVALALGETGALTVGAAALSATSLAATTYTRLDCTDVLQSINAWGVW
jgi:hypothetical protein